MINIVGSDGERQRGARLLQSGVVEVDSESTSTRHDTGIEEGESQLMSNIVAPAGRR